jgi:FdhD protein
MAHEPSHLPGGPPRRAEGTAEIHAVEVTRVREDGSRRVEGDRVAIEAPLEFRIQGQPGAVTMRTPGDDVNLVRGFLFGEGLIGCGEDIRGFHVPADLEPNQLGHVLDVKLAPALVRKRLPERSMFASSSCGVCGKVSLASLAIHAPRNDAPFTIACAIVAGLPERLRDAQDVFAATGGLHAAAAFSATGDLLELREDVGRHNAVDKLVGCLLGAGRIPAADAILVVSGRLSFEIVQKAVVAGFPVIAAVSAPSSMAIEIAERFGVTLCGFVRDGRFNIYTHAQRILG